MLFPEDVIHKWFLKLQCSRRLSWRAIKSATSFWLKFISFSENSYKFSPYYSFSGSEEMSAIPEIVTQQDTSLPTPRSARRRTFKLIASLRLYLIFLILPIGGVYFSFWISDYT
jgi:hypothetical protein